MNLLSTKKKSAQKKNRMQALREWFILFSKRKNYSTSGFIFSTWQIPASVSHRTEERPHKRENEKKTAFKNIACYGRPVCKNWMIWCKLVDISSANWLTLSIIQATLACVSVCGSLLLLFSLYLQHLQRITFLVHESNASVNGWPRPMHLNCCIRCDSCDHWTQLWHRWQIQLIPLLKSVAIPHWCADKSANGILWADYCSPKMSSYRMQSIIYP